MASPSGKAKSNDPADDSGDSINMSSNLKTYTLNGKSMTIKKKATERTVIQAYYPKSERENLSKKERMDLLDKIQAKQQRDQFRSLTVSVNDPQKMTNTRSLAELLVENKRNLNKYDLLDVYNIVSPLPKSFDETNANYGQLLISNGKPVQQDLFTNYLKLTTNEVADSCRWYSSFVDDKHIEEDLNWSLAYYEKNVESDLYSKVHAKMGLFPIDSQGGPLFLKILLDLVTTSSEGNLKALELILSNYQIKTSSAGEDIELVVGLFTSIIETIIALRNGDLPADAVRKLLKLFQTTSVDDFNNQFDEMERAYVRTSIRAQLTEFNIQTSGDKGLTNNKESAKYVLAYAEKAYRDLLQSGEWDKCLQKTPGKSAFIGNSNGDPGLDFNKGEDKFDSDGCFNCGSKEHRLADCPLPQDEERIAKNKARHRAKNPPKTFRHPYKWRLPEANENNKRVINGSPHTWDPNSGRTGRWIEDQTPSNGIPNGGRPPTTVNVSNDGANSLTQRSQANLGTNSDLEAVLQSLGLGGSSSGASQSGDSTIATGKDPMEKKIQLLLAQARIKEAIDNL